MNIKPKKSYGQNFLINLGVVKKIIDASELSKKDTVLEIGPGKGILTEKLLVNVGKVIAVEKDKELYELLKNKFKGVDNLELVNKDILKFDISHSNFHISDFKIVANIPYNITGQILRKFLLSYNRPEIMVIMVQYEVGNRILGKERSLLWLIAQLYGKVEKICKVSAGSFFPQPKVDSAVMKLIRGTKQKNENQILTLAKIGFQNKRKKLISNLSTGLKLGKDRLGDIFIGVGLGDSVRAEELELDDWLKLAELIVKK